jgi:hypothetical protein
MSRGIQVVLVLFPRDETSIEEPPVAREEISKALEETKFDGFGPKSSKEVAAGMNPSSEGTSVFRST